MLKIIKKSSRIRSMKFDERLLSEIREYAVVNNIEDSDKLVNDLLRIGFNIKKYGLSPTINNPNDKLPKEQLKKVTIEDNLTPIIDEIEVTPEVKKVDDEGKEKLFYEN